MKKSLLALAVLGAFASAASAQSSVTLFGIVDVNARWVKNDLPGGSSDSRKTLSPDGLNASRIGVRGVEDLGGGLRAGFWLESPISIDNGTTNTTKFWNRRSTISLLGSFGEVRLGRDYVPAWYNSSAFAAFGTTGIGSSYSAANFVATPNVAGPNLVTAAFPSGSTASYVRNDNSIGYFLPANIGGVYGQAMVSAGEGNAGRHIGGRIGWSGGPVNVAAAAGRTDADPAGNNEFDIANVGASFAFGPATILAYFSHEELDIVGPNPLEKRFALGARVVVGAGEIRGQFVRSKLDNGGPNNDDADLMALGYVHNLSKRTALYTTVGRINNKGVAAFSIAGGPSAQRRGGNSTGVDLGVSHSF